MFQVSHVSPWCSSFSGFSYVDLVEGAQDGRFYALKRILCHDREGRKEAQTEVEMHRLFNHPNVLSLTGYAFMERGGKSEAWLLLPYISVRLLHPKVYSSNLLYIGTVLWCF